MAKRYYIVDIVERTPLFGAKRSFAAAIQGEVGSYVAVIPTDPVTGLPIHTQALVKVAGEESVHRKIRKRKDVDALPDPTEDGKVNLIEEISKTKLKNAFSKRGIPVDIDEKTSHKDMIDRVGKHFQLDFDPDAFDISE